MLPEDLPGTGSAGAASRRSCPLIDALEELLRKMRPYELEPGSADAAFDQAINLVMTGMRESGVHGAVDGFKQAIDVMSRVRYDRSHPRPQVLIVGEYLLNFHPGANRNIEALPRGERPGSHRSAHDRRHSQTYFYQDAQAREFPRFAAALHQGVQPHRQPAVRKHARRDATASRRPTRSTNPPAACPNL